MANKDLNKKHDCKKEKCSCEEKWKEDDCNCKSGGECSCHGECDCNEECTCGEECSCHDGVPPNCNCVNDDKELANQYLDMARQVQADFENYRRHAEAEIKNARISGQVSIIEAFLPCLDTFKEAKKSIQDEVVLKGVEMIEDKIIETLKELGVEKINSIGEVYNPHMHNVIALMKDESKDNDIILDEFQAGYIYNDKIIRYAKVIVNKKEDI